MLTWDALTGPESLDYREGSAGKHILEKGVILSTFIEVAVWPLLKKHSLDPHFLDNFCPVSTFPILGKIVEKVVTVLLHKTLEETDYLDPWTFTQVSGPLMIQQWPWSHLWMTSGKSKIEVVYLSLLFLTSQQVSIPQIIVSFWTGFSGLVDGAQFVLVLLPPGRF